MNASSSDAWCGVSSCRTMPCAAAARADLLGASGPVTSSAPSPAASADSPPSPRQHLAQRGRLGRAHADELLGRAGDELLRRSCRRSAGRGRPRSGGRRSAPSRSSGARRRTRCGPRRRGLCSSVADPLDALGVEAVDRLVEHHASAGRRAAPSRCRAAGPCRGRTCRRACGPRLQADQLDHLVDPACARCRGSARGPAGGCAPSGPGGSTAPRAARRPRAAARRARRSGLPLTVDVPGVGGRGRGSSASWSTCPRRSGRGTR